MRFFLFGWIVLGWMGSALGQLIVKPISHSVATAAGQKKLPQRNLEGALPFWDDFSLSENTPDESRVWNSQAYGLWNLAASGDVYVNESLAINPPSYNVVTFDGLDGNGGFHTDVNDFADQLQSDTIDLFGLANVKLSFYWQAGGHVEIPDDTDSLTLELYKPKPDLDEVGDWKQVWRIRGSELADDQDTVFTQVAVDIPADYLTQAFIFRFRSYGDKDGSFDAWHLDWIYLNNNRQNEDFYYPDRGFTQQLTAPSSPLLSLPPHQFKALISVEGIQTVQAFNLDGDQFTASNYEIAVREKVSNTSLDFQLRDDFDLLQINPDPFKITNERKLIFDGLNVDDFPDIDSAVIETIVSFESSDDDFLDGSFVDLRVNDIIQKEYVLHNYLAFDDGTAEYAAGTNLNGGQIAVKFWVQEADTLTHIDIYFPNIAPASSGQLLDLKVYAQLGKSTLRQQDISITNGATINEFTSYALDRPVVVSDTFYIGIEQNRNEYIGIGLDRSNPAASDYIYENITGTWEKNQAIKGALMIRVRFEEGAELITSTQADGIWKPEVYPNPTSDVLYLPFSYDTIQVYDFTGSPLLNIQNKSQVDLSGYRSGLYLLVISKGSEKRTIKLIKQ